RSATVLAIALTSKSSSASSLARALARARGVTGAPNRIARNRLRPSDEDAHPCRRIRVLGERLRPIGAHGSGAASPAAPLLSWKVEVGYGAGDVPMLIFAVTSPAFWLG